MERVTSGAVYDSIVGIVKTNKLPVYEATAFTTELSEPAACVIYPSSEVDNIQGVLARRLFNTQVRVIPFVLDEKGQPHQLVNNEFIADFVEHHVGSHSMPASARTELGTLSRATDAQLIRVPVFIGSGIEPRLTFVEGLSRAFNSLVPEGRNVRFSVDLSTQMYSGQLVFARPESADARAATGFGNTVVTVYVDAEPLPTAAEPAFVSSITFNTATGTVRFDVEWLKAAVKQVAISS